MEKSLFKFIWKYSKRDQIVLLLLTLVTFPVLYASLELPKRIINDAIGSKTENVDLFGVTLSQVQFLLLLCVAFFFIVVLTGEPMGTLMGEMLSQPTLLTGQMLTILVFLFAQSFWFGLASVAVIPLQAWIIPKLQHKINLLNKKRTHEVRRLIAWGNCTTFVSRFSRKRFL